MSIVGPSIPVRFGAVGLRKEGMDDPCDVLVDRQELEERGLDPEALNFEPLYFPGIEGTILEGNTFTVYMDKEDALAWRRTEEGINSGRSVALFRDETTGDVQDVWYSSPDDLEDLDDTMTPAQIVDRLQRTNAKGFKTQLPEWLDYLKSDLLDKLASKFGK